MPPPPAASAALRGRPESRRLIRVGIIGGGGIAGEHLRGYARARRRRIGVTAIADIDPSTRERRRAASSAPQRLPRLPRRCSPTRTSTRSTSACRTTCTRDAIVAAAAGRRAHPVREAAVPHRRRRRARSDDAVAAAGDHAHVRAQPAVPARRSRRPTQAARRPAPRARLRGPHDRQLLQRLRPGEHGLARARSTSGGGELIDTGYHPTYLLLHLAGGEPAEVTAMLCKHRLTFMEGEDSAQVVVRFANGSVGAMRRAGPTTRAGSPSGSRWSASAARSTATGPR